MEHLAAHGDAAAATIAVGGGGTAAIDDLVLVCAIWVDPAAIDAAKVFANNHRATAAALALGSGFTTPAVPTGSRPWNPYFPLPI